MTQSPIEVNWVHGTEYGWIVRVGMRDNSWADELRTFNISEAAIANIKMILDAGYDVVHFDRDAELVDGMPAWDW